MIFAVEKLASCRSEMEPLLKEHWDEIANDKELIPLAPWWEAYEAMEAAGEFFIVTARDAGKLVGYIWSIVRPHLHYKHTLHAFVDIYRVLPEYRKGWNGVNLFKAVEAEWKKRGVVKAFTASKVKMDMSAVFERLDWRRTEVTYTKVF